MENKVKFPADGKTRITKNAKTGEIFTLQTEENGSPKLDKNKERFGYIRLEQRVLSLDEKSSYFTGGIEKRSALKAMTEKAWDNIKDSVEEGTVLPGKIVHEDSFEEKPGFTARKAGEDGELLTAGGKQIYRRTYFTTNMEAIDDTIDHENDLRRNKDTLTVKDKNTQSLN